MCIVQGYFVSRFEVKYNLAVMTKSRNPLVFLDICIDGDPGEKMVFELFYDVAPFTAENFRALCTGEKGDGPKYGRPLHYKGSFFHQIVKGYLAQGGDFIKRDGSCGESIYNGKFPDDAPKLKHDERGLLTMSLADRKTLGSHFNITFDANHNLDRKHVVFGKLVHGLDVLQKIEDADDGDGKPNVTVKIINCGVFDGDIKKLNKLKGGKAAMDDDHSVDVKVKRRPKHKKSSKEKRRKRRKYYYSSESDSSSGSDVESSESESDSVSLSSGSSSTDGKRIKRKRTSKKDKSGRGRKRDKALDRKRKRHSKKSKRISKRESKSSSEAESETEDNGATKNGVEISRSYQGHKSPQDHAQDRVQHSNQPLHEKAGSIDRIGRNGDHPRENRESRLNGSAEQTKCKRSMSTSGSPNRKVNRSNISKKRASRSPVYSPKENVDYRRENGEPQLNESAEQTKCKRSMSPSGSPKRTANRSKTSKTSASRSPVYSSRRSVSRSPVIVRSPKWRSLKNRRISKSPAGSDTQAKTSRSPVRGIRKGISRSPATTRKSIIKCVSSSASESPPRRSSWKSVSRSLTRSPAMAKSSSRSKSPSRSSIKPRSLSRSLTRSPTMEKSSSRSNSKSPTRSSIKPRSLSRSLTRSPSMAKSTSRSRSKSPSRSSIKPRSISRSPQKSISGSPSRIARRSVSVSPSRSKRSGSIRSSRRPPSRRSISISRSPVRVPRRSVRTSYSRSPVDRARSPINTRNRSASRSVTPDGSPKHVRRGQGFSNRYFYARRYRSPSPDRSYRDRRHSPRRYRTPPRRRSPPRHRRSISVSRSPPRNQRRYSRGRSRSPIRTSRYSPHSRVSARKSPPRRSNSPPVNRSPSRSWSGYSPKKSASRSRSPSYAPKSRSMS